MLKKKKNNQGFTLVELLVVIAIIGILAVVAVPALFKNIEKGKVADLESDISAIRSAVLSYYTNNSEYPIDDSTATNNPQEGYTPTDAVVLLQKDMTSLTDTEAKRLKKQATLKLLSELEGLSFPYEGKYELTNASGEVGAGKAVKSPATLYLKITTEDANTTISEDGLDKLAQDLGLTNPAPSNSTASSTSIGVTPVSSSKSGKQEIIIPLINK